MQQFVSGFRAVLVLLAFASATAGADDRGGRILIAGDSTASSYPAERAPQTGWGQALPFYVDDDVDVVNRAVSGRSTRSFIDEGKWQALRDEVRSGDVVLISFGHNDSRDDAVERYAAADTTYRDNMRRFAMDVTQKGATPVIVSPAARRLWEGPAMVETHGLYDRNAELAAEAAGAMFIDLADLSIAYFETLGREGSKRDFLWLEPEDGNARFPEGVEDNTHFTELGACGVARIIAAALANDERTAELIDVGAIGADAVAHSASRPASVMACAAAIMRD